MPPEVPLTATFFPGIENDTHAHKRALTPQMQVSKTIPDTQESLLPQSQVSKTIPTPQEERTPTPPRVLKIIPSIKKDTLHASTGIENDTRALKRALTPQMQVSKTIPTPQKEHTFTPTRVLKIIPSIKKDTPTQPQVSKTIPTPQEERAPTPP